MKSFRAIPERIFRRWCVVDEEDELVAEDLSEEEARERAEALNSGQEAKV